MIELVCLLIVGASVAEGISSERAQATWDSLLATPLDGKEIVIAKMIGACWKARGGIVLVLVLWSAGLLTGSLHPLGVAAALSLLIASTWFMAALGTHASLVLRDASRATATTLIPLVLLTGTLLVSLFSRRPTTIVMGAGSVPYVNFLCLVSYQEFTEIVSQGDIATCRTMGISTNDATGEVLARTWPLSPVIWEPPRGSHGWLSADSTELRAGLHERERPK